jgi:drug/metabolite transporter (DMT)-like permease
VNVIAAATLLAACLLSGTPLSGFPGSTWAIFAALAVGPHLAGHGLLNLAIRFFPAPTVNLALAGEPLLSTSYAAALLGEFPGGPFYAGGALILTGLAIEFSGGVGRPSKAP